MHGLLLEVPHKPVAVLWAHQVRHEVKIEEYGLAGGYQELEHWARLLQRHENEQVGTLILCLVQQVMDHAVVVPHGPQGPQVASHSTHHTGDTRYGLQEYAAVKPLVLVHLVFVEAGTQVEEAS